MIMPLFTQAVVLNIDQSDLGSHVFALIFKMYPFITK